MSQTTRANPADTRCRVMRRVVGALSLGLSMLVAAPASAQVLHADTPSAIRGMEIVDNRGKVLPLDLPLVNESGKAVRLADYFNQPSSDGKHQKPVVLMMVYFKCPMLCPLTLDKFRAALNQVDFTAGKDFNALVVSFDPRDTPADAMAQKDLALIGYDRPIDDDVRRGWAYLTSTPEDARKLGDALGFPYRYQPDTGEFAHGACVFIATPDGKVSRYLTGLHYPPKDVRLALLDASNGKLASVFDRVSMWCYHFDPTTGKYSLVAMRVMQVGSAISVAFIGGVLFTMWRWERRRRARRAALAGGGVMTLQDRLGSTVGGPRARAGSTGHAT
ncbi:MAG: SCO family protein [Phycisphaerales bacterium]|nr:SCO family protein [Phycisphaerales bacterium]